MTVYKNVTKKAYAPINTKIKLKNGASMAAKETIITLNKLK